ncbi:HAMP domain-containing sensor histidine kinase [Streptomyces sp. NPDC002054]|uniref:sensor histidine kinase n=1 Tax=Streptomyces sp. NPDC002054 TaxID=3154663 RepID=UPI003320D035
MTRRALRRRLRPLTIRARVTLFATVLVALPMSAGAAVAAVSVRDSLLREAREATAAVADRASNQAREITTCEARAMEPALPEAHQGFWQWCEPSSVPGWTAWLGPPRGGSLSLRPWTDPARGSRPFRVATIGDPRVRTVVFTVKPLEPEQAKLNSFLWRLGAGVAGVSTLVAGSAWFGAGRVLRPVEAIRTRFAELSAHQLDRRVPVPRGDNEITRLAQTMNATLDRLQGAVEQQRRFTADASHELRTPLAALRAELEIALARPEAADWPDVVHGALGDTMRLQHLTTDLLLLARLDADGTLRRPGRPVDLAQLVCEETARRHPPTPLRLTTSVGPGALLVDGHPALLARVLGNLLDNAVRHASRSITVSLGHDPERRQAVLEVLDDGPGIAPEHRTRVFERFTRLDDSRTQQTGGTGLGLAIAHHITTLHQGTLAVTDSPRGARLTVRLPVSTSMPASP